LLGLQAKAAITLVVGFLQPGEDALGRCPLCAYQRGVCGDKALRSSRALVLWILAPHLLQPLHHLVGRHVDPAVKQPTVLVQNGNGRETALIVSRGEIWAPVYIDPDRNELRVDQANDLCLGIRGLLQHMAPVAPGGSQGEQNGLVLLCGAAKRLLTPLSPVNSFLLRLLAHSV
jgi:hypothetical protein